MVLQEKLKDSFIGGLILLTPLILTVIIIQVFLGWTSGLTGVIVQVFGIGQYVGHDMLTGQLIVLTGTAVLIVLTGIVARSKTGRTLLGGFGRLVNLVPMYRTLYFSLKHFADSLVENRSHYENAIIAEYPQKGAYRLGFTTSRSQEEIQEVDDKDLLNVFMPNSPNPTGGQMAILPEDRVYDVDLSVREAFKLVMTTGISNEKVDNVLPGEDSD